MFSHRRAAVCVHVCLESCDLQLDLIVDMWCAVWVEQVMQVKKSTCRHAIQQHDFSYSEGEKEVRRDKK